MKLTDLISRAIVRVVNDVKKIQAVQAVLLADETRDDIERAQNYGFTSVPLDGAQAIVLNVDGRRDHSIAIVVDDRRYRLTGLANGEVAVYDQTGTSIVLKANGDIQITPSSGTARFTGNVTVSGTLTATTDVVGGGKSLKDHVHTVAGGNSGGPVVFTLVDGQTGKPV